MLWYTQLNMYKHWLEMSSSAFAHVKIPAFFSLFILISNGKFEYFPNSTFLNFHQWLKIAHFRCILQHSAGCVVNAFLLKETLKESFSKPQFIYLIQQEIKWAYINSGQKKTPPKNPTPVYTIYYTTLIQHSRPMQCTPVNTSTVILSPYETLQYKSMRVPHCLLVLFVSKVNTPLNL